MNKTKTNQRLATAKPKKPKLVRNTMKDLASPRTASVAVKGGVYSVAFSHHCGK